MPLNSVNHNDLFIGTHTQNSPISGFSNGNEPESSFYFIPKKRVTTSLDIWFFKARHYLAAFFIGFFKLEYFLLGNKVGKERRKKYNDKATK